MTKTTTYQVYYTTAKFILLICVAFLIPICVYADNKYVQFTNTSGLSNSAINCICQDSSKVMWLGTWDGLNAFNGKEFTIYTPSLANTNAISNNIIRNVIEQTKGIIWITTDHGINRMDTYNSSFSHFYFGY